MRSSVGFVLISILLTSYFCITVVESYKFLAVLHTSARSHFIVGSALMKALASKGHEVYVISAFPQKPAIANYHDVHLQSTIKAIDGKISSLFYINDKDVFAHIRHYFDMGLELTEIVLKEPAVRNLMATNHTFDAVICDVFISEALFGLSEHFKAPLIGLGTFGAISLNADMIGSPSPPSYIPHTMTKFTDHMSLMERIINLAFVSFERLFLDLYYLPKQSALYQKYFPHLKRDMDAVRKNASIVLLNTHVSLGYPRPYMPNHIEVGGMHINRQRKPLPHDIEKFIQEAAYGVIYFSMGSNLKSKDLPHQKKKEILNAFSNIKQRVLWKFEDPYLVGKPDNVFISEWFPQDDILAHDNVKLFITHCGLLSTTESVYHAKPIIGIPIFGDQFLNMAKAEANGYGIRLDYQTLNAKTLVTAIDLILTDKSYAQRVREMSLRYRDQPMLPMDLAIYWVEYVARNKGARYLHCAGLELSVLEYHNIDAIVLLYGGIVLSLLTMAYLIGKCLKTILKRFNCKEYYKEKIN